MRLSENTKEGLTALRLVSVEQVLDIITKYENRSIQKTMVYEVGKLRGCLATEEQMLNILGEDKITFTD